MTIESMLTTVDNPYDPFKEFDLWHSYDIKAGYHTASLLSQIVKNSPELSEADQSQAIEDAIDEIIQENVNGVFRKVSREVLI